MSSFDAEAAVANLAEASTRAEQLSAAVDGALWLDESALEAAAPAAQASERFNVRVDRFFFFFVLMPRRRRRRQTFFFFSFFSLRAHFSAPRQTTKNPNQALARKLLDLKAQLDDARALAAAAEEARRAAEAEAAELREERDNARASLREHVAELVERGDEVSKLKGVIQELTEALGSAGGGGGGGGGGGANEGRRRRQGGGGGGGSSTSDNDDGDDDDSSGLPSAPKGDTRSKARAEKLARDVAELDADRLAAEMIAAAEEEQSGGGGGGGDDFSSLL